MAIKVSTDNGHALLTSIYKAIVEKRVQTWRYIDHEGERYLTHSADQWDAKAWLKGSVQHPGLVFNIVPPKGSAVTTEVYAIYHGRFIEMLLAHFDSQMGDAAATAKPVVGDVVKAA